MSKIVDFIEFLTQRNARRPISALAAPWDRERVAIYRLLSSSASGQRLPQEAHNLPDDTTYLESGSSGGYGGIKWAPGATDALFRIGAMGEAETQVHDLKSALEEVSSKPSAEGINRLYRLMVQGHAASIIDMLLTEISRSTRIHAARLYELAEWLVTESPDREPVKFGIALLGMFAEPNNTEILLTLGRHDEFTIYSVVALERTLDQPDLDLVLWQLAREVHGWGRIHIVTRLSKTEDPDIRHWLLREGFRNAIMNQYLAHACAVGGRLLDALRGHSIDDALFLGVSEILDALMEGGPAEDMSEYGDGAAATRLFIQHAGRRASLDIRHFLPLHNIRAYVQNEERDWSKLAELGWSALLRRDMAADVEGVLSRPEWAGILTQALESDDYPTFRAATAASEALGIDVWDKYLKRQRDRKSPFGEWYHLMRTSDPARIDQVLALALQQIDLAKVATGPGREHGIGSAFQDHRDLDFVLQELRRFPGKGWAFVDAGLQSPVTSNRNLALRTIGAWSKDVWPEEVERALQVASTREPDDDVRERIGEVLGGDPLTS